MNNQNKILINSNIRFFSIFCGFIISYVFVYIGSSFFFGAEEMRTGSDFFAMKPIGVDLVRNMKICEDILKKGGDVWDEMTFSPLWVLLWGGGFAKLSDMAARLIIIAISLLSYITLFLYVPRWFNGERQFTLISVFVMSVGFTSYGLIFDLERAQWNLPVMLCCLASIALWKKKYKYTSLPFFLYIFATHMKIWPAVFCICFIRNKDGWKKNIARQFWLMSLNLLMLFILGPVFFIHFIQTTIHKVANNFNYWTGNHSIASFSHIFKEKYGAGLNVYLLLLVVTIVVAILAIGIVLYRTGDGSNHFIIIICSLLAMLLPKISHDYKLVVLAAVITLFYNLYTLVGKVGSKTYYVEVSLLVIISSLYHITLYSTWRKRAVGLFTPNTPILIGIEVCIALLAIIAYATPKQKKMEIPQSDTQLSCLTGK